MPTPTMCSQLSLPCIRCQAFLGWGEEERSRPQSVWVMLRVRFAEPPAAVISDRLEETVDVAELCVAVRAACAAQPFRLLERMAQAIYDALRPTLPVAAGLWVEVAKEHPPLLELVESARFGVGDVIAY